MTRLIKCNKDIHQRAFDALVEYGYITPEQYYEKKKSYKMSEAEFSRSVLRSMMATDFGAFNTVIDAVDQIPIAFHRNECYADHARRIDEHNRLAAKDLRNSRGLRKKIIELDNLIRNGKVAKSKMSMAEKDLAKLKADLDASEEKVKAILLEQKIITLMMVPRGCLKTTLFIARRGLFLYLRDRLQTGQAPVCMLLHADKEKAQENLDLVKQLFTSDIMQDVFGDWLITRKNDSDRVRFEDNSPIKRKEPHFTTGSVSQDFGGKHATYYLVDDWVLDDNTITPARNEQNKRAFWKLFWLNDHSGRFRIEMVGTHYYDDSIYCDLLEKRINGEPIIEATIIPARQVNDDNEVIYNFPEVPIYNKGELEKLEKTTPKMQFQAQVLMKPQPRVKEVDFELGDNYLFKFQGELGEAHISAPMGLDAMRNNGCVITCKDPSYSTSNKSFRSNVSKDSTITAVVFGDILWVYEAKQLLGGSNREIYEPLLDQAERNQSDVVIVDAQGTQSAIVSVFEDWLGRDLDYMPHFIPYTKPSNLTSASKAERAMLVLAQMFALGKIKIHHSCRSLIAEIERDTTGWDYLDTLIMIFERPLALWESLGQNKSSANVVPLMERYKGRVKQQVFKRTGG